MIYRTEAIDVIYNRIKNSATSLGIIDVRFMPSQAIKPEDLKNYNGDYFVFIQIPEKDKQLDTTGCGWGIYKVCSFTVFGIGRPEHEEDSMAKYKIQSFMPKLKDTLFGNKGSDFSLSTDDEGDTATLMRYAVPDGPYNIDSGVIGMSLDFKFRYKDLL